MESKKQSNMQARNVGDTHLCTTLCHNSPHDKLQLVRVCQWVMWGHTLTNHNSPCDELWHKIVHKCVSPAFLHASMHIQTVSFAVWSTNYCLNKIGVRVGKERQKIIFSLQKKRRCRYTTSILCIKSVGTGQHCSCNRLVS